MIEISGATKVCMAIGDPVESSLSPLMHNYGYKAAGLAGTFVYVPARVTPSALSAAISGLRGLSVRGASILMPHKSAVMVLLDEVDDIAKAIGAVNTVVNNDGVLTGFNTDWLGVVGALETVTALRGKEVAVLGAGGTARAACFGLKERGSKVTIFNRTVERAERLAQEFGCCALGLDAAARLDGFDIVVNATSVGMQTGASPLPEKALRQGQIVCDVVYHPLETRLLKDAAAKGCEIVFGTEVLLHQGAAQFELYTGRAAPVDEMRRALRSVMKDA